LNLDDTTIICRRCHAKRICFKEDQRSRNGKLIPLDYQTFEPHFCDISDPFPCRWCGEKIYLDNKILSAGGKRIPLNHGTDTYHFCDKKPRTNGELRFFKRRGLFEA